MKFFKSYHKKKNSGLDKKADYLPDESFCAVGDIHGRLDLWKSLQNKIKNQDGLRFVFLGDYIDRGMDSAGIIDELISFKQKKPDTIFVRGNHEQVLLDILGGNYDLISQWIQVGGRETLMSYYLPVPTKPKECKELQKTMVKTIPQSHQEFLADTQYFWQSGDIVCVHAGLAEGFLENRQFHEDMLRVREPFLSAGDVFGCLVIHGHTIVEEVEERPWRISMDTGAYATGKLSALVMDKDGQKTIYST